MGAVTAQIVRKIAEVSRGPVSPEALLEGLGLSSTADAGAASRQVVAAEAYYDLLERCFGDGDYALPFRYGAAMQPEGFGAFGLAFKTARTVNDGLERLVRYILVVTDTLEYQLSDEAGGRRLTLKGRPSEQRRGIELANEAAFAAISSLLRRAATEPVSPTRVSFRHPRPANTEPHAMHFDCEVRFDANWDSLHFSEATLGTAMRLGDDGLSSFLLSQLDELHSQHATPSLVRRVRGAVTDTLCDGLPRKGDIARQLGMSERTLQRHLAEHGQSFQAVVNEVRREVAESLLSTTNNSLSEVAFLTGFSDQSAFQRAFKGWTGQTPLGFRQAAV